MFTLTALIGAAAVPPTFQVIVPCPDQEVPLVGEVMRKGPAEPMTATCTSALATPPAPARLSRALTRKFIVRFVEGSRSPAVLVLLRISESCGNVRLGLATGVKERKSGLLPLSREDKEVGGPRSRSSQHHVRASPSGSPPEAVN